MTTLADKVAFAREHWTVRGKEPFEIDEAGWLYKHYWRPLHSFRLWPVQKKGLCEKCRGFAGQLVEDYYWSDRTRTPKHRKCGCSGLTSELIQFVLIHLKRRSGKTVGTAGYIAAELFKGSDQYISFISGSEDQTRKLFRENYRDPIVNNPRLDALAVIKGNSISVESTGSVFEFFATSLAGATGGTSTIVIVDEARNVPADVATALINTSLEQSGWVCPCHTALNGHTKTHGDLDEPRFAACGVCGSRMLPWAPKVLAMTSAGEVTGGAKDWFFELLDANEEEPEPRAYIFSAEETVNAKVAKSIEDTTSRFLGKAESMRAAVDMESHNIPRKRGEDVITQVEIKRCSDRTLGTVDVGACGEPAFGFCDCATLVEKVSIAAIADDTKHPNHDEPWSHVYIPHLRFWVPADCKGGVISDKEVEKEIETTVKRFPAMKEFWVDTRGLPWAVKMVKRLQAKSPTLRKVIRSWGKRSAEGESGWMELEIRYRQRTIRHPYDQAILREAKGLMRRKKGDRLVVDDINRKKSHKDILENFAMLCYLVLNDRSRKRDRYRYEAAKGGDKPTSRMRKRNPLSRARHGKINFGRGGM